MSEPRHPGRRDDHPQQPIVFVSFSNLPSPQNYLYNCQHGFSDLGLDAHSIGSARLCAPDRDLDARNHLFDVSDSPKPSIRSTPAMLRQIRRISREIEDIRPSIVHFTSEHSWNYPLIVRLRRRLQARIVHTFHDPLGHDGDRIQKGVYYYHKILGHLVDDVIVHSAKSEDETRLVLRPRAAVHRVPLGSTHWADCRLPSELTGKLLVFGRLNAYKGVHLIPAIAAAVRQIDPNVTIVIAGSPSAELSTETLHSLAAQPNISLRAEQIPESELDDYFWDCDAVLLTHTSITQSGVILDALSHARPIVAFAIPGVSEYLPPETAQATAFDTSAFAEAAVRITRDLDDLRQRSRVAWSFGRDNFSDTKMVAELFKVFDLTSVRRAP